jgi:hypothetical protein
MYEAIIAPDFSRAFLIERKYAELLACQTTERKNYQLQLVIFAFAFRQAPNFDRTDVV